MSERTLDVAGNLKELTTYGRHKTIFKYNYDSLNNVSFEFGYATDGNFKDSITYQLVYNQYGLASRTSVLPNFKINYEYNNKGLLISEAVIALDTVKKTGIPGAFRCIGLIARDIEVGTLKLYKYNRKGLLIKKQLLYRNSYSEPYKEYLSISYEYTSRKLLKEWLIIKHDGNYRQKHSLLYSNKLITNQVVSTHVKDEKTGKYRLADWNNIEYIHDNEGLLLMEKHKELYFIPSMPTIEFELSYVYQAGSRLIMYGMQRVR